MNNINRNNNFNNINSNNTNINNNSSYKVKLGNISSINEHVKKYEINKRKNFFNKNNPNNIQDDKFYNSFDNKSILPSIPNNKNNINNINQNNFNNDLGEEKNENILDKLMNQRLMYQNKMPENSRFKIKFLV